MRGHTPDRDRRPTESFARSWAELAPIGRDDATGGYARYAWTDVDARLADWFAAQAARRGLAVEVDRNGNQWAWWGRPGPGAVVTGSHLDSVPGGGAYDGPLGVLSAFLALDDLRGQGRAPARPVAVVRFVDEEGARFGVACAGSRLSAGLLAPEVARSLVDSDRVSLAEAMRTAGHDPDRIGPDRPALDRVSAFVELHIEQGRGLADAPAAVGLATQIWPHGRWRISFSGAADHAGTTRLADRRDPMLSFAATVLAARDAAQQAGALATVGKVRAEPGASNGIAAAVHTWLDCRAPEDEQLSTVTDAVGRAAHRAAAAHDVAVEIRRESHSPAVRFDRPLRDRLERVLATTSCGPVPLLSTGAGHDAGILASAVPSAMLFVRNPTGVSHSPAERATDADCLAGIRALSAVLADLAC